MLPAASKSTCVEEYALEIILFLLLWSRPDVFLQELELELDISVSFVYLEGG